MRRLSIEETAIVSGGADDIEIVKGVNYSIPVEISPPDHSVAFDDRFNDMLNAPGYAL
jgi:hypothetical protein